MGWIRWTGKTLEFAGKLVQAKSFEEWAEGQGKALVEKLGVEAGGVVLGFGTAKKGRSIVWGELRNVAENSPSLAAAINMAASRSQAFSITLRARSKFITPAQTCRSFLDFSFAVTFLRKSPSSYKTLRNWNTSRGEACFATTSLKS